MSSRWTVAAGLMLAALFSVGLAGCGAIGAASGAVAATATGLATANPAIGIGVGIAVNAVTDEVVNRYLRSLHADQQDAIAARAGILAVGEQGTWRIDHVLPLENGHGQVRVVRSFSTPLGWCKEFAFSWSESDEQDVLASWYLATACRQQEQWRWASAEPAVQRWATLQ